jgi:hypothetical protein
MENDARGGRACSLIFACKVEHVESCEEASVALDTSDLTPETCLLLQWIKSLMTPCNATRLDPLIAYNYSKLMSKSDTDMLWDFEEGSWKSSKCCNSGPAQISIWVKND